MKELRRLEIVDGRYYIKCPVENDTALTIAIGSIRCVPAPWHYDEETATMTMGPSPEAEYIPPSQNEIDDWLGQKHYHEIDLEATEVSEKKLGFDG